MARYLLSVNVGTDDRPQQMTDEEMREGHDKVARLEADMRSSGSLVMSARLEGPEAAFEVNATNGTPLTTDGPFVESKEVIGGFYIVEAPDRDTAREWAARTSAAIGMPIQVRPLFASADGDDIGA